MHSHGPGCPGSGQPPVLGSVTSVSLRQNVKAQSSSTKPSDSTHNSADSSQLPSQSPTEIIEFLRLRRCRVLKRVPKALRIPAAEKLAETLRQVVADPDCIGKWVDLLLFTFSCFAVPGQRGGKRHLASLASKINAAVASFPVSTPSTPTPVLHKVKPSKSRLHSLDNLAARVSSKLEDGDIRGAIRLAASDDTMAPFDDVTAAALQSKHPARATIPTDSLPPTPSSDSCLCL